MNPAVVAAIIAASVSVLTLIGTLAAQYFGRRATSRELDRTLAEQRTRTLNERFATAADRLGGDKPSAVRLAGVYAMAGLADDWEQNRQTCVEVLCGYLRMPYEPDPGDEASEPERLAFRASHEVRRTIIRVITAHLRDHAPKSWQGLNFDFTGAVFDGGDFSFVEFSGGTVSFWHAEFSGGLAILFDGANFSGGEVDFTGAKFSGEVSFDGAKFSGATVLFDGANFSGGTVHFRERRVEWADLGGAEFSGGTVSFRGAKFSGGDVKFDLAQFSGGMVDFSDPGDWSFPPSFPWTDTPPPGVKLPKEDQSTA
jgi:hypothetical protein